MDYLYGKLNFEVERVDYTGVSSSTAKIDVDKKEATIKVDVIKTPNNLIIDNLEDDSITYFDGSKEIIIELPKVSDRVLQSEFDIFKANVENDYNQKINAEEERALKAESELRTELNNRISQEVNNILDGAPEQLNTLKEISNALNNNELLGSVVIQNQTDIANEITRATKAEADLNTLINDTIEDYSEEFNNFKQEVNQFAQVALQAIDSEVNRATKAEEELSATITNNKKAHDDEYDTFKGAVQASFDVVDSAIQDEVNRAKKVEEDLTAAIETLTNGSTTEEIDSVKELINYVNANGELTTGLSNDIKANTQAIKNINNNLKIDEWNNEIGAKQAANTAQQKADSAYTLAEGKEAAGTAQTLINNLDKTITGANPNKTLKSLSQTDGFISAEFQDISITKSQISDFNESDYDAAGSADSALTDSKDYTDDELSKHNTDVISHSDIRQLTSDHNINTEAHSDIRQLISNLSAKEGLDKTGTVTSVKIDAGAGLSVDNENEITTSGTRTLSLTASGVNAATYGPNADVTGTDGTTIKVPEITVDTYGRVTNVTERIYTSKDTDTHITVDGELNSTSTNPVQNKVINAKFESLNDAYDSKGSSAAAATEAKTYAKDYTDGIVATYLTGEGAADTIDTLNEIANWIRDDEAGAAKIISDVVNLKDNKADKDHTHSQYLTEHQNISHLALKDHSHDDYADKEHEHENYLIQDDLVDYAKKTDLFSKNYNDLTNTPAIPSIAGLATETYVNNAVKNNIPEVPTTTDGVYILRAIVKNGNITYSWEVDNGVYVEVTD